MRQYNHITLFELPTYPKGTIALSLYAVAAAFQKEDKISIIDFNVINHTSFDFQQQVKSSHK